MSAACSDRSAFDRAGAVDALVGSQGWTAREAGCWVDRVRADFGDDQLEAVLDQPGRAAGSAYAAVTVDCISSERLVAGATSTSATASPGQPWTRGDDPDLDALWDRCAAGDGSACDELFEVAPLGSPYEEFAATCGGRGVQPVCATGDTSPVTPAG